MPIVTAGLKCAPETCPTAYAIVVTARPKAMATPRCPMPRLTGAESDRDLTTNFASKIAEPQPMKTSQKVPSASTARRELILGVYIGLLQQAGRAEPPRHPRVHGSVVERSRHSGPSEGRAYDRADETG